MPIEEMKPVAWRWRTIDGGWHIQEARPVKYGADIYGRGPLNEEPLYTHPTPIAADTPDARLIAAAPDLLASLDDCAALLEVVAGHEGETAMGALVSVMAEKARAAILSATKE